MKDIELRERVTRGNPSADPCQTPQPHQSTRDGLPAGQASEAGAPWWLRITAGATGLALGFALAEMAEWAGRSLA